MAELKARLLCRTGQLAGVTYELGPDSTIGRDADNDAVLLAETVSGKHARIFIQEGSYFLEDLGSRNGTLVDGVPVEGVVPLDTLNVVTVSETCDLIFQVVGSMARKPVEPPMPPAAEEPEPVQPPSPPPEAPAPPPLPPPAPVGPTTENRTYVDLQTLGPLPDLEPAAPTRDAPDPSPDEGVSISVQVPGKGRLTFDLTPGENVIGRSADCSIVVDHHSLSRKHAALIVSAEGIVLKDLGSTNGTFLEEREVSEALITPGTRFALGAEVEVEVVKK